MAKKRGLLTVLAAFVACIGMMLPANLTGQLISPCIDCSMCAINGVTGHKTSEGDSTSIYNRDGGDEEEPIHGCITGTFCNVHGADCDITGGGSESETLGEIIETLFDLPAEAALAVQVPYSPDTRPRRG